MEIRVLGSSGSEGPGRNPTAFLIDDFLLLDAGTVSLSLDLESQTKITHIFLTHAHLDHIKAIPFLVDNIVATHGLGKITILSGRDVIADLKRNVFNNKIWPDFTLLPSSHNPIMRYQVVSTRKPIEVRDYRIFSTRVSHSVPAYGYVVADSTGEALVYTGDTGPTDRLWKRIKGFKVKALIIETSFPDEMSRLALDSGHLTPSLLHKELRKLPVLPDHIYITHLKPYYREEIKRQLAELDGLPLTVLSDNLRFSL